MLRTDLNLADYLIVIYVYPHEFASHYSPLGNWFCGRRDKNGLVELLNPKPIAY